MTETTNNLPQTNKLTNMQEALITNLFIYPTIKKAAKKAGYADQTCNKHIYTMIKQPHIQNRIIEEYKSRVASKIPKLAQIEAKIFKKVLANPKHYKEYKDVFKQAKQHVGLLSEDTTPKQPTISITHIEKVQVAVAGMLTKRLNGVSSSDNQE